MLIVLAIIIGAIYVYMFPYQKASATKNTERYIEKQGIAKTDIESQEIWRDWKLGGYLTRLTLKNDPNITYEYSYSNKRTDPFHIYLIIYDDGSGIGNDNPKVKFKTLE